MTASRKDVFPATPHLGAPLSELRSGSLHFCLLIRSESAQVFIRGNAVPSTLRPNYSPMVLN